MPSHTNRLLLALLTTLLFAGVGLAPVGASAQEVQITGPLAGQPAVRHMRQYRVNRFFITPSVGYTLQDEFARALFFGGSLGYHFTDWLGISAWGAGAPLDIDTDLTSQIRSNGQVTDRNRLSLPSASGFPSQVGRIRWGAALQILFIPLRGKLSLFQAGFVDTDLYVIAGVAVFGIDERAEVDEANTACDVGVPGGASSPDCVATQSATASRIAFAPMLGVGLTMMFNTFLGLQIEWRAFPFSWNPSGTDESGLDANALPGSGFPDGEIDGDDSRTTFNHMVNIGLVVYLPTEVQVGD
jgi:outer membrane beta-barrel protein